MSSWLRRRNVKTKQTNKQTTTTTTTTKTGIASAASSVALRGLPEVDASRRSNTGPGIAKLVAPFYQSYRTVVNSLPNYIWLFLDLLVVCNPNPDKCRMLHTSLISFHLISSFCKIFTAYHYFVLSQTQRSISCWWTGFCSLFEFNIPHWRLKTKWPVDRKSELFNKWKTYDQID